MTRSNGSIPRSNSKSIPRSSSKSSSRSNSGSEAPGAPPLPPNVVRAIYARAHPAVQARMRASLPTLLRNATLPAPRRDYLRGTGLLQHWWNHGAKTILNMLQARSGPYWDLELDDMSEAERIEAELLDSASDLIRELKKAYRSNQSMAAMQQLIADADAQTDHRMSGLYGHEFGRETTRNELVDNALAMTAYVYLVFLEDETDMGNEVVKERNRARSQYATMLRRARKRYDTMELERAAQTKRRRRAAATKIQAAWRGRRARKEAEVARTLKRAREWRKRAPDADGAGEGAKRARRA